MLLDFEKPIVLLEEKLALMKERADQHDSVELKRAIHKLEKDILALKKKTFHNLTRWQRVQLARHTDRPYTLDYIRHITNEFIELHGDRSRADDKAIVGGFGKIGKETFMLIGHQKGRNIKERQSRNFGMANPEGYRKALRLMKLGEKFNKPIITFIDTPGAYPGLEAEEHGQAEAIAKSIQGMFMLRVPIICIVIGEGASGGALAMAIGDRVLMLTNTWYSIISPEACSSILWKNGQYKEQAAEVLKLSAQDMLCFNLIDEIIEEPLGGAHRNREEAANCVKKSILYHLPLLQKQSIENLLAQRMNKFCTHGSC